MYCKYTKQNLYVFVCIYFVKGVLAKELKDEALEIFRKCFFFIEQYLEQYGCHSAHMRLLLSEVYYCSAAFCKLPSV